jgi:hypothetical protein
MLLTDIFTHFDLGSRDDPCVIPFLKKTLPYLVLTARGETALYFDAKNKDSLSQDLIERFLKKLRNYDAVEVSKIVENWRKEYGVSK